MLLRFLLAALLFVGAQAYVTWRVWQLLPASLWVKLTAAVVLTVLFVLFFVALSPQLDNMPMWGSTLVYNLGTSYVIVLMYLLMLFLVLALGRVVHIVPHQYLKDSAEGTAFVTLVMAAVFIYGNRHYYRKYIKRLELQTDKPVAGGETVRIVMASDLHLGYHNDRAELARWVNSINAQKPSVVLIAGDIIDRSLRPLTETCMAEEFHRIEAPIFACPGNHEYFAGINGAEDFYREAGIHMLRDEVVTWNGISIVGRDDRSNHRRKALKELIGANTGQYTIVLDHQPYELEEAEGCGVDMQFSGHTHYGQVWPASWLTDLLYENAWGFSTRGETQYYVSSGLGIWGGKFRIGTRSEFVVAELKPRR